MCENYNNISNIPDNIIFTSYLDKVFSNKKNALKGLEVISREPAAKEGTFEAEIVRCSFTNSPDIIIRCKYLKGTENNQEGGHRGAVEYEAKIYEELLEKLKLPLAHFYGKFQVVESNIFCMVLEYLESSIRITQVPDKSAMLKAAEWIGLFHSIYENKNFSYIKKYDEKYYDQWNKNVQRIGQELNNDFSWIQSICHYFEGNKQSLLASPQTIIHGEYYPNNILYKDGSIYPVDWESAALAIGEIDLASLTEGWDDDFETKMITKYIQARWQSLDTSMYYEFQKRLNIAKLYLQLRWMGRYPDFETWKSKPQKFKNFDIRLEKLYKLSKSIKIL